MPTLRAVYNPATRVVNVAASGTAVPGGSVAIGNIEHPEPVYPGSVVIAHGVRDLLYKRSAANPAQTAMFPKNITDIDRITIDLDWVDIAGIVLPAGEVKLGVGETFQLKPVVEPKETSVTLTYTSNEPGVATVSSTGLVTAVAGGKATILMASPGKVHKVTQDVYVV